MNYFDQHSGIQYEILNTELEDLNFSCSLFNDAIAYQKRKGYPEYRWDDRKMQRQYILEGIHFKMVTRDEIVAVFQIHFHDKKIWREMDNNLSVYLHGVLINPKFKGHKFFENILNWTVTYAQKNSKNSIRLDTWHNNPDLLNYYKIFGFYEVEDFQIPNSEDIPLNCRGNKVTLMEYKI